MSYFHFVVPAVFVSYAQFLSNFAWFWMNMFLKHLNALRL